MKKINPFIVLEAINGAGKTTQFNLLNAALEKAGYAPHSYHFHQRDRATGQVIEYKFHHDKMGRQSFTQREQALLYIQDFYSRAEDFVALRQATGEHIIIADRFYTSTLAYQTIGLSGEKRRKMIAWIKWLCEQGEPRLLKPDLVILLDTPVHISAKHLIGTKRDFFEQEKNLAAIRRSYLRLAEEEGWIVINSADERGRQRLVEDIHQEIWQHVTKLL